MAEDAKPAGRRLALLIGNEKFLPDSGFETLRGPHNDLDALAPVLTDPSRGGFNLVQAPIRDGGRDAIMTAIEDLLTDATQQDTALIYYSGHGELDRQLNLHFAAAETNVKRLFTTGFSAHTLHQLALGSRCREIIVLLDCCFAGAIGRQFGGGAKGPDNPARSVDAQLAKTVEAAKGVFVLASSTAWQTSREAEAEHDGRVMGRFTRAVVDRLLSSADQHQGDVRLSHLTTHLERAFPGQEPREFRADAVGDPLIARAARRQTAAERREARLLEWMLGGELPEFAYAPSYEAVHGRGPPGLMPLVARLLDAAAMTPAAFAAAIRHALPGAVPPVFGFAERQAPPPAMDPFVAPPPAAPPPARWTPPREPLAVWREPIPDLPEATCPEMVTIPYGRFRMGAPEEEKESRDNERPRREVTVEAFALGRCAVTFAQWDAAIEAGAVLPFPGDGGWGRGDRPVINISWDEAAAYCEWLSHRVGSPGAYRLPSEAEWEYACRAGTTTPFSFGATLSPKQANYDGNYTYGAGAKGEYRQRTVPVGSLPANPWGLHEMHGNVWEWVEDAFGPYPGHPTDARPLEHSDSALRVLRGGSWLDYPRFLRSAFRYGYAPGNRNSNLGFRVARTLF